MKSIKNLSDDFKGMGTGGYLVVPRNLLGRVLDTGTPFTPAQAYMYLYVRCEFCNRKGKEALKRGQMTCTSGELADRFMWSKHAVRDFLRTLRDLGVLEMEVEPHDGKGAKAGHEAYRALFPLAE